MALAVLFSIVNTMILAGRQRVPEAGILKALGFTDAALARLMLAESVILSLLGGGMGVAVAKATEEPLRRMLGQNFPTYHVEPITIALGLGVALVIGLVAGLAPAWMMARLRPTDALRSEG